MFRVGGQGFGLRGFRDVWGWEGLGLGYESMCLNTRYFGLIVTI